MAIDYESAIAQLTGPGAPFAMHREEIGEQSLLVFDRTPATIGTLFGGLRTAPPDEPFLVFEDEVWSFGATADHIDAVATLLVDRYRVARGDRVAIAMRNYPEWITAFAATASVGAVAVALNAWSTTDELRYALNDSGARVLVADAERVERVRPLLDEHPELQVVGVRLPTDGDLPARIDRLDDVIPPAAAPDVEVTAEEDAMILYTSGTTGEPKGAVSTHRAVMSALTAFACRSVVNAVMKGTDGQAERTKANPTAFILVVPLFHVTGLVPVMLGAVLGRSKLVMMYKWNPERALELIERERITTFVGVPTMSWDLLESPDFARRDTSSLVSVGGGGAPAPPELVKRIEGSFSRGRPSIGYGMTETNAYGPQNIGDDYLRRPTSTGRTVPVMQVRVADDDGHEVPRGHVGEIQFRGANLIRGYWNKPDATAEAFTDGWLRTGDIGRMDDEGFVYVEDRAKDMVIRGGENIYCAEVEAAIYEHPAVYEAAVFGIPHERLGEELVAAIVLREGQTLIVADLQAHIAQRLASFKVPTKVVMMNEQLPRGATGKILKRQLRDSLTG